jgi:hypothetical protein
MGVTIHFHGAWDDPARLDAALAMLREECERRGWPYRSLDFEARGPHETYTFHQVPGPLPDWTDVITETEVTELDTRWRGLSIEPHSDCESLLMMFDEHDTRLMLLTTVGDTNSVSYNMSVKTRFAPPEIHVAVCEVLHRLQGEFGREKLIVHDESNYFQTQNMEALLKMRGVIEAAMNDIETITRVVQLGAIGDELGPPDEGALYERRN